MYYGDEIVNEVLSRNDIVDVIGSYVNLKRSGSSYTACCPFHSEKTPSFHVSREKQMYKCFGCGAGGSAYTFLMKHENFTFPEAVRALADRVGYQLPQKSMSAEAKKQADAGTRMREMNKTAALYFYAMLKSEQGDKGLEYFKGRGLTDATITKFGLGFASKSWDDLYKYLKSKGYKDEELKASGLIKFDEKYGGRAFFWNRVMFPIMDTNDRVIGFGGRVLGDGTPKYLNSSDTLVFNKRKNLYGLNLAKKSKRLGIIFCEGYMDVISMHQAGFDNAVASLGTALTGEQVHLVKRYTDRVYLAYDSDEAGTKAALKAIQIMREAELPARVISLKPYKDPDELIQSEGVEEFEKRIEQAKSAVMFEIDILANNYNQGDPQGRTEFQKEAAKTLSLILDPLERQNYIDSVAKQYQIDGGALKETVTQYGTAGIGRRERSVFREQAPRRLPEEEKERKELKAERLLITWMINENALFDALMDTISPEDFFEPVYHSVVKELFEQYRAEGKVTPAVIMNHYQSEEEHEKVAAIMQQDFGTEIAPEEKSKTITDLVRAVKERSILHQLDNANDDLMKVKQLTIEKSQLQRLVIKL